MEDAITLSNLSDFLKLECLELSREVALPQQWRLRVRTHQRQHDLRHGGEWWPLGSITFLQRGTDTHAGAPTEECGQRWPTATASTQLLHTMHIRSFVRRPLDSRNSGLGGGRELDQQRIEVKLRDIRNPLWILHFLTTANREETKLVSLFQVRRWLACWLRLLAVLALTWMR